MLLPGVENVYPGFIAQDLIDKLSINQRVALAKQLLGVSEIAVVSDQLLIPIGSATSEQIVLLLIAIAGRIAEE